MRRKLDEVTALVSTHAHLILSNKESCTGLPLRSLDQHSAGGCQLFRLFCQQISLLPPWQGSTTTSQWQQPICVVPALLACAQAKRQPFEAQHEAAAMTASECTSFAWRPECHGLIQGALHGPGMLLPTRLPSSGEPS